MLNTIVGNNELKADLISAMTGSRLAHSIMLCGEVGVGVGYAAKCLAADFLYPNDMAKSLLVMQKKSPELLIIEGEGASGDIKIEAVRAMREEIFSTSLSCERRCVILRQVQHLNASSANALLKVLEEPPDNVLFILTSQSAAAVLPTIRSRCCSYTLAPVSVQECSSFITNNYKNIQDAERLSQIYGGRIGCCVAVITDERARASLDKALELCDYCEQDNEYAISALLSAYEKNKAFAQKLIENARAIMSAALRGTENTGISQRKAALALPALYEADKLFRRNVGDKLIFTNLAIQLTKSQTK